MKFTLDKLLQFLGCAIVIIIALYIIMALLKYQTKILEGLTNISSDSSNNALVIKDNTTKTLDTLLIDKYRGNYEDVIINMHDWCDAQILDSIVSGKLDCQNGCNEKLMLKIKNIHDLESFKSSLNKTMKYLDKQ